MLRERSLNRASKHTKEAPKKVANRLSYFLGSMKTKVMIPSQHISFSGPQGYSNTHEDSLREVTE